MAIGDVLRKVLVAVIDARTTVLCLECAGQVKPIGVPYDTLNGPIDVPPFHVHCRSISVPFTDGMENPTRQLANRELANRPPSAFRHVPPRPTAPPDMALPPPDVEIAALDPKAAWGDVPPEQRKAFMDANPDRFVMTDNGGGISESYWVTDKQTGMRYVLKKGSFNAESMNEVMSSRIASGVGLPGRAMIAGPIEDGNGWVLVSHTEDLMPGYKVQGVAGGAQFDSEVDR